MPYPAHVAYTVEGAMPGGEIWACTLRFGDAEDASGSFPGLDLAAGCNDALAAWLEFFTDTVPLAVGQSVAGVTGRVYNAAGQVVEQGNSSEAGESGIATQRMPNQVAVVYTLGTADQRRRARGRIYVPHLTLELESPTPYISAINRQNLATAMASLIENGASWGFAVPPSDFSAIVASATFGSAAYINNVRVGSVFDTQRRRRNALIESYSSAPVLGPIDPPDLP